MRVERRRSWAEPRQLAFPDSRHNLARKRRSRVERGAQHSMRSAFPATPERFRQHRLSGSRGDQCIDVVRVSVRLAGSDETRAYSNGGRARL